MHLCDIIQKFIIFSIFVAIVSTDTSICGNWTQYNDEKCILIFSELKFLNYEDSVKACSQIENSVLLTINSKEDQEFISQFLFITHKILDNIWIGLKRTQNSFQWIDNSDLHFTNWANGSPSNTSDRNCTQLSVDSNQLGKWVDEPCVKNNLVVCQKTPTASDLLKIINEMKKDYNEKFNQINKVLNETKNQLNVCKNSSLSNKFNYSKTFIDDNGKQKAFIIPMNENGGYDYIHFDEAVNYCAKYNSTLIELQSQRKQSIFESFMREIGEPIVDLSKVNWDNPPLKWFWINARRDSSGKFKWITSGKEFSFTNWYFDAEPKNNSGYDYVEVAVPREENFGKWYTKTISEPNYAICELDFNI